jgi:hypothetical protein
LVLWLQIIHLASQAFAQTGKIRFSGFDPFDYLSVGGLFIGIWNIEPKKYTLAEAEKQINWLLKIYWI